MKRVVKIVAVCLVFSFLSSQVFGAQEMIMKEVAPPAEETSRGIGAKDITQGGVYVPDKVIDEKQYTLGPGDSIAVSLIIGHNEISLDYNFIITPVGKIFFPNVGEMKLAGLTIVEARKLMEDRISNIYSRDFTMSLLLSQPKKIKVMITGMSDTLGPVTVWDGTRLSAVLGVVGTPLPGESKRFVNVKRKDLSGKEEIIKIDLYDVYRKGDIQKDIVVKNGDIINIPLSQGKKVTITGKIARPGVYELKQTEKLRDLLYMAGYLDTTSALSDVIFLQRQVGGDEFTKSTIDLNKLIYEKDETQNIELQNGDVISIPAVEDYVSIYGEVGAKGRMPYAPGKKLSDYIFLAGGPTDKAILGSVTVTRQENGKPRVYWVDLGKIIKEGDTSRDIEIKPGDIINVPANFFYFADFAGFSTMILTFVGLYNTFIRY